MGLELAEVVVTDDGVAVGTGVSVAVPDAVPDVVRTAVHVGVEVAGGVTAAEALGVVTAVPLCVDDLVADGVGLLDRDAVRVAVRDDDSAAVREGEDMAVRELELDAVLVDEVVGDAVRDDDNVAVAELVVVAEPEGDADAEGDADVEGCADGVAVDVMVFGGVTAAVPLGVDVAVADADAVDNAVPDGEVVEEMVDVVVAVVDGAVDEVPDDEDVAVRVLVLEVVVVLVSVSVGVAVDDGNAVGDDNARHSSVNVEITPPFSVTLPVDTRRRPASDAPPLATIEFFAKTVPTTATPVPIDAVCAAQYTAAKLAPLLTLTEAPASKTSSVATMKMKSPTPVSVTWLRTTRYSNDMYMPGVRTPASMGASITVADGARAYRDARAVATSDCAWNATVSATLSDPYTAPGGKPNMPTPAAMSPHTTVASAFTMSNPAKTPILHNAGWMAKAGAVAVAVAVADGVDAHVVIASVATTDAATSVRVIGDGDGSPLTKRVQDSWCARAQAGSKYQAHAGYGGARRAGRTRGGCNRARLRSACETHP